LIYLVEYKMTLFCSSRIPMPTCMWNYTPNSIVIQNSILLCTAMQNNAWRVTTAKSAVCGVVHNFLFMMCINVLHAHFFTNSYSCTGLEKTAAMIRHGDCGIKADVDSSIVNGR
jgi:hypothetical protein